MQTHAAAMAHVAPVAQVLRLFGVIAEMTGGQKFTARTICRLAASNAHLAAALDEADVTNPISLGRLLQQHVDTACGLWMLRRGRSVERHGGHRARPWRFVTVDRVTEPRRTGRFELTPAEDRLIADVYYRAFKRALVTCSACGTRSLALSDQWTCPECHARGTESA